MSPFHRIFSRVHPSAACVGGIAAAHISGICGSAKEESKDVNSTLNCSAEQLILSSREPSHRLQSNTNTVYASNLQQHILASSPSDASSSSKSNIHKDNTIDCDYVVIGHGRAGQSAVRTLKYLDPSADIIILDPNNLQPNNEQTKSRTSGAVHHLPTRATFIEHSLKVIRVSPIQSSTSESQTCNVHYRKSMLIATGCRGAPPPEECIAPDAKSRILELRSTSVSNINNKDKKKQQLPILNPSTVRSLALMAASQGATVAVMGSGFEALELAASLARASPKAANDTDDNLKVQLLFGNSGPLSSRLPRYLSAAIAKRLRQSGIDVEERSMMRYLSMENSTGIPRLELYTLKSYDRLDSRRLVSDLLVLAPSVGGMNGTAVLPVANEDAVETSNNYQPWSSLVSPSLLTCYLEDGRVATNSEFLAASHVYAAGSVAKYPRNGQADIAGGDHMSAELSGEIAARNMVKETSNRKNGKNELEFMPCHVQETIPVWRSDQVAYVNKNEHEASSLALYSMGIHALCVGKCDSTMMATHGFWWTNTNNQSESKRDADSTASVRPNSFMRRITRRATNFTSKGSFTRGGALPVYGSGVVYYLDQCGSIQGVMLWGLPFSEDSSNVQTSINDSLVERMKEIIRTNGGIVIRDHSDNIVKESYGVTMDVNLLSYLHLAEESKHLASTALKGSVASASSKAKIVLGRPLHRYTPWKPSEMTHLGKVRRKDDAGQIAGVNDLFYSTSNESDKSPTTHWTNEPVRPPSLKRIYTMQGEATWLSNDEAMQLQQERSRPSKEDPLWLRQAEEFRYVNKRESMANEFISNMLAGQFSDGSEAVKQAPMPKIYLDAKERIRSWTASDIDEDDINEEVE
jgi:hypothetical protein